MASKKKQKGMVFRKEWATTPAAAPAGDHPPACFAVPKPGKASEGGMEQSALTRSKETDMMSKPNIHPSPNKGTRTHGGLPAVKHPISSNPQSENLSPDSICKGIRVTLDNNSMWNEFFRCKTEMILTKQGSRMFPYCRFRISGLQPSKKYSLLMDIQPLDNSRYKWSGKSWQVAGKAECHIKSQPFAHPESPSTGQHWMQNPVSFYKLKLTNNNMDQEGNTILHPMHRYLPRLHVIQTDKAAKDIKLNGPGVVTFTFPQTEFMAVTAYQNSGFAQLKVDYNPFAKGLKEDGSSSWGLKLKLNSGKDSLKDEGTTNNEQHTLKKSLKSLLANHKPRSSKAVESKPSVSCDLQKNSTTNRDQSDAMVTEERSCSNSHPAQKLFSELIREAHVSLQRCNLEQLGINNSSLHRAERTNTRTNALKSIGQDVSKTESVSVKIHSKTSSAKKSEVVVTKKNVKEDKDLLNELNCKDNVQTDCSVVSNVAADASVPQNSSLDSDQLYNPIVQTEVKVKQHKRPAPLPLPALALFLKQHSVKSKKPKTKPDSPLSALPPESLLESQSYAVASASLQSGHDSNETGSSKDLMGDITKSNKASKYVSSCLHPDGMVFITTGQAVETSPQPSSSPCPDVVATKDPEEPRIDHFLASISGAEDTGTEPIVTDGAAALTNSDQSLCTLETSTATISSTLATSGSRPIVSPPLDTVLSDPDSPQTPTITESSTLPSDPSTLKSDHLLPDPECYSFHFEPMSPASSPEPLPSLPTSLTLQLNSSTTDPTLKASPPKELLHIEDPATSVFKWHTVLPPPEPYIDTSFTAFQSTPQALPLASVASPLLPCQTPSHPEPQTFDASTSTPPPDAALSFQENEQSLPFPAELSPLALQLPLSPTFSSIDGDGLSPTPSITDLVQFFSTNDDLGMGEDFSNTEAIAGPCPLTSTVEANAHEPPRHVQPGSSSKLCKCKRKSWRQKLAKADVDQKTDDSAYTRMQPNLEEVEEQLFISFTSKEALKLHVVDSSEETPSHPQTTPEHLQQTTDASENDKSSLPDSIHPNNFPAKLWRLVNNPANKAVCWDSHGKAIIIDQLLFEKQILSPGSIASDNADAFKTTNFSSFVRQLNLYGFRKPDPAVKDSHHPPGENGMYHQFYNPNFKQNHPELLTSLRRLTVNNKAKIQAGLNVRCRHPSRSQRVCGADNSKDKHEQRAETADSLQQKIIAFEKVLLRDLKLMRHRQVIHPVLQAVGLKMNLLDPTLAIDLQYLGVHLPLPPPGVSVEPSTQELPPPQGVCSAFVSRTGKTTDVTQIKGWREKFTASEAPPTPAPSRAEAGPSSDLQKKNLSAFCSDMLDEYLENEAKLIDERAASFSQPVVEPVVYELPTRSTSYVRTLHSVLRKESSSSPTSDLISGFIPPSKRPKLNLKEPRASRRDSLKQKGPKLGRPQSELGPAETKLDPKSPAVHVPVSPQPSVFKGRKKLKPRTSSQTLSALRSTAPPPGVSEDMAPLESDSELGGGDPNSETCRRAGGAMMTRALLRQKDLEDGVVWEGKARTSITKERAAIALTSLFTLMGFVSENPTAPIQLVCRRAPPCLNEFCRLGCVCSSLSHSSRISHCGRSACMLGCSCLKQKVVLLKNLDGSDSSPSHHGNSKKRRRKRRMKMAYILKEADSVSQPAERVRTLWKRDSGDSDPDPIHVPKPASVSQSTERISAEGHSSCARVRGYSGKKKIQKQQDSRLKPVRQRHLKETNVNLPGPPAGELVHPSDRSASPAAEPPPRPSKRLIILAECKWVSDADRNHVLKTLCERMAWDQLDKPFWVRRYLISPMGQTVEWSGSDHCVQYKIHISRPKVEQDPPAALVEPVDPKRMMQRQDHLQQVVREVEPVGSWQQEVKEEETEPPEDWQREVEEGDIEEEAGSVGQVHDGREHRRQEVKMRSKKKKKKVCMGLPFLTGICPAGFLSANRKQPGGTDQLVQVNAKLYPLARIQLGRMGALHPANRLAAYLTGRVGSNRKQEGSLSCPSPSKPPQKNLGPTPPTVSTPPPVVSAAAAAPPHTSQPSVAVLTLPTSNACEQVSSSAASPVTSPPTPPQQLIMVQVPGLPGVVPVPALKPCPLPPGPTPQTQRMILKPVQGASGVQYYRRPDGKLVQLVINQLRPVAPNQALKRGSSSLSVVPPSCQTPVVSVINKTLPVTTVTTVTSASSSPSSTTSYPSLSAPQVSSVSPLPSPLCPPSVLPQKSTFTFKILPADSSRKPITVTCTKVPPRPPTKVVAAPGPVTLIPPHPPTAPVKLISLKPSAGRGAEPGAKAVTVGPAEASIPQRLPPPQTAGQNPLSSEVTHPELETASDLVDVDVVCVDDETELITMETAGEQSSSETENSSDFGDETDREEEKESAANSQRLNHNMLEKQRRVKLLQLFEHLRRETGLSSRRTSKISTLKKAVQVIQELRRAEADLQQKKKLLMERREDFLRVVALHTEVSQQVSGRPQGSDTEPSRTGSKDAAVIEVVDLLNETKEPTDNLSDGERVIAKTASVGAVTEVDDGVQSVAMERKDKRRLAGNKRNKDSGFSVKPLIAARSLTAELRPGKTEPRILKKLHPLLSTAANQQPAAGGRASDPPSAAATDDAITFNNKHLQAPPSAASAPPIATPALTPVQQAQVSQTVLQVLSPTLVAPGVSHNASVLRDRVRTVPNILSRTKNLPLPSSVLTKPVEESFQALVPADVLSLVNAALPGQPVLTLSPLMAGPTVLQTSQTPGVASVTLNIPSLTNQQIHLTSLPHPPTGKIYSSSAPVTIANLTGTNLNNLLQLVHPSTTRQQQQQQQEQQQLRVPAGEPHPPFQPDSSPASSLTPPPPPLGGASSANSETLTSLLHEIVFLNQQAVATVTTAGSSLTAGQQEEGPAHSPWLLQVDPEDTVAMETEEAGPRDQEMTPSGPISGNTTGGVLAPPPLLQMKVGGAKVVDPASKGGAVGRDEGRGGRREGGVAWKPMPRLVPLGLRGNPPS